LDNDGDPDLVVANLDAPASIYRNDTPADRHRIRVRLKVIGSEHAGLAPDGSLRPFGFGPDANRFGFGAVVRVTAGGREQVRELSPSSGFLSSNDPVLTFGLGSATKIERLTVHWPGTGSGHAEAEDLAADFEYVVDDVGTITYTTFWPPPESFKLDESQPLNSVTHEDPPFDDYARQPLLPWKHSRLGPGMAWGDVNGDGRDDFYLGHAAGSAGRVYFNLGGGKFEFRTTKPFDEHAGSEDMAPLFFDADRDGDTDLYVVSGSVECERDAAVLQDRLYLNDGKGNFSAAPAGALPDERSSGSCAVAADFDRDGDLDVFVGGRIIPGAWPETPLSLFLRNDSKPGAPEFTDLAANVPSLQQAGLVTGALWSDADGDGWIDLLVCTEWGPVKVFMNRGGTLTDATEAAGLALHTGWWNGIAGRDLDHDGDIDYVATNYGPNGPYHASAKKPVVVYYGDLDGTGRKNIVEAKQEGSVWYPRRGFSCSSAAMPELRTKLKTFHNFASASLADVYGADRLKHAQRFAVTFLESCALMNDGKGRFTVAPLPLAAQMAPAFGIVLSDFDGDEETEAVLAQNFFSPQPENGQLDSGMGAFLRAGADGSFHAVQPSASGIVVPGDAKGLSVADVNGDGLPDLIFGVNAGALRVFVNDSAAHARSMLGIRLTDGPGNPCAVGARVTVRTARPQTAELVAGGGYLSQDQPVLWFGTGGNPGAVRVEVRWPDGTTSRHEAVPGRVNELKR
jgi:hypothetical protein